MFCELTKCCDIILAQKLCYNYLMIDCESGPWYTIVTIYNICSSQCPGLTYIQCRRPHERLQKLQLGLNVDGPVFPECIQRPQGRSCCSKSSLDFVASFSCLINDGTQVLVKVFHLLQDDSSALDIELCLDLCCCDDLRLLFINFQLKIIGDTVNLVQ